MAGERASYPPGFRFHPTDEELVGYYLCRKVFDEHIEGNIIHELDLYKFEPWDLPDGAFVPGSDRYFFSPRDQKYTQGGRTNRATVKGYWKATGRDRTVNCGSNIHQTSGMKKTLVFYLGRAPNGERTDWVMHEYRLVYMHAQPVNHQDAYVLCRIFNKKGDSKDSGPSVPGAYIRNCPPIHPDVHVEGAVAPEREWGFLERLAQANKKGVPQEELCQAFKDNYVASTTNATKSSCLNEFQQENQFVLEKPIEDSSFSVDELTESGLLLEDNPLLLSAQQRQEAADKAEVDTWINLDPEEEAVPVLAEEEALSVRRAEAPLVASGDHLLLSSPEVIQIQTRGRLDDGRPPLRHGRMRMAGRQPQQNQQAVPISLESVTPGMLSRLRLTLEQWNELNAMAQEKGGGAGESEQDVEVQEISQREHDSALPLRAGENLRRRRQPAAAIRRMESLPDSIKVDTLNDRTLFSESLDGSVLRWEGADELNDVTGSEGEGAGAQQLRDPQAALPTEIDPSMTSARTRYVPKLTGLSRASRVLIDSKDPTQNNVDHSSAHGRSRLASAISPVLQGLIELLGPAPPAHAGELSSADVKPFMDEAHLSQLRGFGSAPQLRKGFCRDVLQSSYEGSGECSGCFSSKVAESTSRFVDSEECSSRDVTRRQLRMVCDKDSSAPLFSTGEYSRAWSQRKELATRRAQNSNRTSKSFTWCLAIVAIFSLCIGVGSFVRLGLLIFKA